MVLKIESIEFKLEVMEFKPSNGAKMLPLKLSLDGKILTTMGDPRGNY
jgi:hypothetical protein